MTALTTYIFRHAAVSALVTMGLLLIALWLTQSLRFMEVILDDDAPVWIFLQMVGLFMVNPLYIVLPVGTALAVLFAYNRLQVDRELVVMRAAGISPWRLMRPALLIGLLIMLLCYLLTVWAVPAANREFRDVKTLMQAEYASLFLRPGHFNIVADDVTIYFRDQVGSGEMVGLMIHDARNPQDRVTIFAARGTLSTGETGRKVVMFDGNRQERDGATGRLDTLFFDQYAIDLEILKPELTIRYLKPFERYIGDLLSPDPADPYDRDNRDRLLAEAHMRLVAPLQGLALTLIAAGAVVSGGFSRGGGAGRLILAAGVIIGLQVLQLAAANTAGGSAALIPLIYGAALLSLTIGLVLPFSGPARGAGEGALERWRDRLRFGSPATAATSNGE